MFWRSANQLLRSKLEPNLRISWLIVWADIDVPQISVSVSVCVVDTGYVSFGLKNSAENDVFSLLFQLIDY